MRASSSMRSSCKGSPASSSSASSFVATAICSNLPSVHVIRHQQHPTAAATAATSMPSTSSNRSSPSQSRDESFFHHPPLKGRGATRKAQYQMSPNANNIDDINSNSGYLSTSTCSDAKSVRMILKPQGTAIMHGRSQSHSFMPPRKKLRSLQPPRSTLTRGGDSSSSSSPMTTTPLPPPPPSLRLLSGSPSAATLSTTANVARQRGSAGRGSAVQLPPLLETPASPGRSSGMFLSLSSALSSETNFSACACSAANECTTGTSLSLSSLVGCGKNGLSTEEQQRQRERQRMLSTHPAVAYVSWPSETCNRMGNSSSHLHTSDTSSLSCVRSILIKGGASFRDSRRGTDGADVPSPTMPPVRITFVTSPGHNHAYLSNDKDDRGTSGDAGKEKETGGSSISLAGADAPIVVSAWEKLHKDSPPTVTSSNGACSTYMSNSIITEHNLSYDEIRQVLMRA